MLFNLGPKCRFAVRTPPENEESLGRHHHQPSRLNPQHSTLNAQRSTLNPRPSTLNPQPSALKAHLRMKSAFADTPCLWSTHPCATRNTLHFEATSHRDSFESDENASKERSSSAVTGVAFDMQSWEVVPSPASTLIVTSPGKVSPDMRAEGSSLSMPDLRISSFRSGIQDSGTEEGHSPSMPGSWSRVCDGECAIHC
jgi:hypothetical protein